MKTLDEVWEDLYNEEFDYLMETGEYNEDVADSEAYSFASEYARQVYAEQHADYLEGMGYDRD